MEDVEAFVRRWDVPGYGVYFGVATRAKAPGNIENSAELPALWIDNDDTPKDELRAILLSCAMPPSLIVDSGRGLHAYWLLNEPEDISEAATNDHPLVDLLKRLRQVFNGDPAVCDLARIMRLPGTHNTKHGDSRPVTVVHQSDVRYELADLREWLSWQRELIGEPANPFLAAAERMGIGRSVSLDDMEPGRIHEIQLRVSAAMLAAGKGEEEIVESLMAATRLAAGEEGRRWNWKREEAAIREMIKGAQRKFSVVQMKPVQQAETAPEPAIAGKEPIIGKVARVALEAWARPVCTVLGDLWTYEGGIWKPIEEHDFRTYVHGAARALNSTGNATLNGAWRWIVEDPGLIRRGVVWDRAGVIVCRNGALDLANERVIQHSPEHWATRRVEADIDPAAGCPLWRQFLADAFPDSTVADLLQEWFGSALVRGKPREVTKGLILVGPSYTGKTQVADVLRALVSGKPCGMKANELEGPFGLQPLLDASGWIVDDAVQQGDALNAERWKVIVTGEAVSIARKNKTPIETRFDFPVCLTANHLPRVKDDSDAVYNRALVIPMQVVRSARKALERPIAERIIEAELGGVFSWAMDGWRRLEKRGWFDPPPACQHIADAFKKDNSPISAWVAECLEVSPHMMVDRRDVVASINGYLLQEYGRSVKQMGARSAIPAVRSAVPSCEDHIKEGRRYLSGLKLTDAGLLAVQALKDAGFGDVVGSGCKIEDINHVRRATKF